MYRGVIINGMMTKGLILVGGVLILAGIALLLFEKIPFLGRLPGDIHIKKKKEHFEIMFPSLPVCC